MSQVAKTYELARQRYADCGVDTDRAVEALKKIAISLHCWQGDDVGGFENADTALTGGIQATGNYPGKARTAEELRSDLDFALKLIPGKQRLNLHALYAEKNGSKADRDTYTVDMFRNWIDWAKAKGLKLDFNASFFSHPKSADGATLSSADPAIRKFWIEHGKVSRRIAAAMGKELGGAAVNNIWIPDGSKDIPADREAPRLRLVEALDEMFREEFPAEYLRDAVESKLFGIGSESYVVGSHEFYMGYAVSRDKLICLDAGHFHPTETISDKLSGIMPFVKEVLLHVSRGVRWDSDHVVMLNDDLNAIAQEIIRHNYQNRVHIGLDYFDASINRLAAWVIGTRNMQKALLNALLEPYTEMCRLENTGDFAGRLALMEESKTLPMGAVWDYYCESAGVPVGFAYMNDIRQYEKDVLAKR